MFRDTRKDKLKNRVIYLSIAVVLLTTGIMLNYKEEQKLEDTQEAVQQLEVTKQDQEQNNVEGTSTESVPETYLIKEVDGVVKVFLCDNEGGEELYLITSIPFDLLSEEDQQLFVNGVVIETEEDLGAFLQNFDS
jgi:ABC-type transport system involved in multi-copper enzyme maturation permease subunit